MTELEEFDKICENERENANPCAWCDLEIDANARDKPASIGICEKHENELLNAMWR